MRRHNRGRVHFLWRHLDYVLPRRHLLPLHARQPERVAVGVAVARTHGAHRAAVNGAHRAADRVADRDFDTGLYNRARQLSREREPWWVVFVWKPSGSI